MRISLSIPIENTVTNHGYGVAAQAMVGSLQRLGHSVPYKDPSAPVEIAFCQPGLWQWSSPDSYKIGYVPWESTKIPDRWLRGLVTADEIWTTSPWCKLVYEKHGFENVHVYEHGVDSSVWTRKRRKQRDDRPFRFLHMGEPAPRKGGQLAYDTFKELYADRPDVTLTIKSHGYSTIRGENNIRPDRELSNVTVNTEELPIWQLVDLIHRHDVLIYPSWGEGFGLIPLQAMATGMPVICTANWAPYRNLIIPELALPSRMVPSPWPDMHPGMMYEPSGSALKSMMQDAPEDFATLSARAYRNSFLVESQYDLDKITESAFAHIVERFSETA